MGKEVRDMTAVEKLIMVGSIVQGQKWDFILKVIGNHRRV